MPVIPDEAGVLDAGDGVEGLGVDGWRRMRRVGQESAAGYTRISIVEILSQHGKAIKCAKRESSGHGMIKKALVLSTP